MRAIERIVVALYIRARLFELGYFKGPWPADVTDWSLSTGELVEEVEVSRGTVLQKAHDLCNDYKPRGVVVRKIDKPGPGYHWAVTEDFYKRVGPAADVAFEELVAARGAPVREKHLMDVLEKSGRPFGYDTFGAVGIEMIYRPDGLARWNAREEQFTLDVDGWLKKAAADQRSSNGK